MKKIISLLCSISFVLLVGCAPKMWEYAQKEYAAGNMFYAIKYSVETLREKPNYKDAVVLLKNILPITYNSLQEKVDNYKATEDWDNVVDTYKQIQSISEIVETIPPQTDEDTKEVTKFDSKNVSQELENAINHAAEKHYKTALGYERTSNSKEAAKEYRRAMDYVSNYKDSAERYERMRTAAIKRIAVMPFENKSGKQEYGDVGENISDQAIGYAMEDSRNVEFLEFVTRDRLNELMNEKKLDQSGIVDEKTASRAGKVLGVYAFVFGKVNSIVINTPPETKAEYNQSRRLHDYSTKKDYDVYARVFVTTRKASANVKCTYQIIDVSKGTIVKSGTVSGVKDFMVQFGVFQGQEAALDNYYRNLCSKQEEYPPSNDVLVSSAIEDAAKKLSDEITGFFK